MSNSWQLGALMKKNFILMKRNCCTTLCEILFPIILMLLLVAVRRAIAINEYNEPLDLNLFLKTNSTALISYEALSATKSQGLPANNTTWNGLQIRNNFALCKANTYIAAIGNDPLIPNIKSKISQMNPNLKFLSFNSINDSDTYVKDSVYSVSLDKPELCFGFYFQQIDNTNFNYSLHYFDSIIRGGKQDTPSTLKKSLDPFQTGPDMSSFQRWQNSGYMQVMKIINDVILQKISNNSNAQINFGVMSQKYSKYKQDPFSMFIGFILPFFLIIAYVCPLCVLVFRMVQDKESRAKEGMKIMGLKESVYFLSYFFQWLIVNTVYSIINSIILTRVLTNVGFIYILGFFWLYGMCIFALAFFFQSLMDKTRIAMIITILVYFIMYFVSVAVLSEDVDNLPKMFMSLLPPTTLQLGLQVLAQFESGFKPFKQDKVGFMYNNYSVGNMYLMFFIDFFIYLFLGYYFDNVLTHQYGIKKPFYFLCTRNFWRKNSKPLVEIPGAIGNAAEVLPVSVSKYADTHNFQSENAYQEKIRNGDALMIKNLKKEFDDGKVAVDGLNLNLYKGEIFALLGHNGAGKSTTISILCGLYEASSGEATYQGQNVLDDSNMENFRKKLGICPQHDVLFENLTVREHLNMFCVFKGVDRSIIDKEIDKILQDVQMVKKADELAKNLSGGQKRKLSIAIALIGGSEIVFLDEPSSGMDISSRRNLWEILKKCTGDRIIVLTTHYMEEAAVLGNRIGIVANGKLKCCGNSLFLINNFGKYISLNIYKESDADDEQIIQFIRQRLPSVECDILSEEILFRIPKNNDENEKFSFKNFFNDLDYNVKKLRIKSYGASMPTLEDVFLNVSADTKQKLIKSNILEDRDNHGAIPEENQNLLMRNEVEISCFTKFISDLKVSLKKRFLHIIRDTKSFILEILCPIILVLIGLGVSSVQFIKDSPSVNVNMNELPSGQKVTINSYTPYTNELTYNFPSDTKYNLTYNYVNAIKGDTTLASIMSFWNQIYQINDTSSYGSYYVLNWDKTNQLYEFIEFTNIESRNAAIIYAQNMMTQIHSYAAGKPININFIHSPFPLTSKLRNQGQTRNTSNLVFFVSIAFALIPANFITIIIKERESNTKHLQIISGISLSSYWVSNYIFELMKYYVIGGINLLLIYAFGNFPYYLWLLYLIYGFSMISFTYMLSLMFKYESTAQNVVILINFLFGALAGSVILILRILEDLVSIGKGIAFIFRIVPSFAFSYGFNQLLSAQLLFTVDYPNSFVPMVLNSDANIIKSEYVGMDVYYMIITSLIYLIILICFESCRNCCRSKVKVAGGIGGINNDHEMNLIDDSIVKKEIEKANNDDFKPGVNANNITGITAPDSNYSIRVKNLEKVFTSGIFCGNKFKAVNKLSFCLEFGECFALLGVNGAGKTTTFKALTCEDLASGGEIFINGMEISSNFNKVRNIIGYCPQFDAIFEYMSVYENLEFYACLKGIAQDKVDKVVESLMKEMNLTEYRNKISGNLSGGNKRKLSVTIAMIGNPPIVLLDEPSTGMDPEARRFMWAVIHKISTRSKKSSVILTTHSMEEAETLCRRMGIMVSGQFKCLGTGQHIKDRYGFGFEIDLRIRQMPEEIFKEITARARFTENMITMNITKRDEVSNILNAIKKTNYILHFEPNKLGSELMKEMQAKGSISVRKLIEWTYFTENFMKCVNVLIDHFPNIYIAECLENSYKLKIEKDNNVNRIGFLFGLMEDQKEQCYLAEYSISQTSLEQIFNKFASEAMLKESKEVLLVNQKEEIKITKEEIMKLIS